MPSASPSASVPSLSEVRAWNGDYLTEAAAHWTSTAQRWQDAYDRVQIEVRRPGGQPWTGQGAEAALQRVAADQLTVRGAVDDLTATAAAAREAAFQLAAARQGVLDAVHAAQAAGLTVDDDYTVTSTGRGPSTAAQADALAAALHAKVLALAALDARVAAQISHAANGVRALDFRQGPAPQAPPLTPRVPSEADRKRNESDAFEKVFGHPPVTANDWQTAAALDPHSYDPKNQGQPPNIVVGKITPVPGQGVVKTNLFIPGEKAWTPFGGNLGDDRGFDPTSGPEDSRVTIYTDFDNGVVVTRQNPSVLQDSGGAQVKVGTPDVRVSQNPNGSVLIRYHAADPFSPGGEQLALETPWNVNGDLVIKPTAGGPIAGGTITEFPAAEIYQVNGGSTVQMAQMMPQNVGEFGPLAGLPFSQQIGQPGLMAGFPDDLIVPPAGVPAIPDVGGPHVAGSGDLPVIRIPAPVVIPYPSVELAPVDSIPQVPVGR